MFVNRFLLKWLDEVILIFSEKKDRAPLLLSRYFRDNKTGQRDRLWISDRFYFYLRHKYLVNVLKNDHESPAESVCRLFSEKNPEEFVNRLRLFSQMQDSEKEKAFESFPPFLRKELLRVFPEKNRKIMKWFNSKSFPVIRTNTVKTDRDSLKELLEKKEGIISEKTEISPFGLLIKKNCEKLTETNSFRKGLFELQDESSQLSVFLLNPESRTMLDACAGGGGKTIAAAAINKKLNITASDLRENLFSEIKKRSKRGKYKNIETCDLSSLKNKLFDSVFVDAPCTGSGVLRRNPEDKWRITEESLKKMEEKQLSCLNQYAKNVKPGGELIYVTCSFIKSENSGIVKRFLEEHPDFKLFAAKQRLSQPDREYRLPEKQLDKITNLGCFFTYPLYDRDVFFGAVMERS